MASWRSGTEEDDGVPERRAAAARRDLGGAALLSVDVFSFLGGEEVISLLRAWGGSRFSPSPSAVYLPFLGRWGWSCWVGEELEFIASCFSL